jgi:hypothetical protein
MTGCEIETQERKVVVALVPSAFRLISAADTAAARLESGRMIDLIRGNFDQEKRPTSAVG